jgi:hypothetical protein
MAEKVLRKISSVEVVARSSRIQMAAMSGAVSALALCEISKLITLIRYRDIETYPIDAYFRNKARAGFLKHW